MAKKTESTVETTKSSPVITNERFFFFINSTQQYLRRFSKERSVLTFALTKLLQRYSKSFSQLQLDLQELQEDVRTKFCEKEEGTGRLIEIEFTDKQGNVGFRKKFTENSDKLCRQEILKVSRKFHDDPCKVIITPHFVSIPKDIPFDFIDPFTGFVFEPLDESAQEKLYLSQGLTSAPEKK